MTAFSGLVAQAPATIPPLPAQKTLDLLLSYGVPYPGNNAPAPSVELIRLSENENTETPNNIISMFLTQVYPKLKPTPYTSVGISFSIPDDIDPNTQSAIYNFYTVTGNKVTDIVPAGNAIPINATITDLERTYSHYALTFIMDLFYKHMNDITDNPHHDSATTLVAVWTDFFQTLYKKYTTLVSNPITLDSFILYKTTRLQVATDPGYELHNQALFIVPVAVAEAILADHNAATDASVHPQLQASLSSETALAVPSIYITPDLFLYRYHVNNPTTTYYYKAASLDNNFPRINASLFVQAAIAINTSPLINILTLSNSTTTDTLRVVKIINEQNSYQIILTLDGTVYQTQLNTSSSEILFVLNYTSMGITITYVDQTGNQNIESLSVPNLVFDFDTIQLGLLVSYPVTNIANTLQKIAVYKTILSSDEISLLFNTIL